MRVAAGVLLVAALAAGCGGSERLPALALGPVDARDTEGAARLVTRFVAAARAGDTVVMRELLSGPTRASFGPGAVQEVARQLDELTGLRVLLARAVEPGWAVVAVAGRNDEGEPAAWAAALRSDGGSPGLELGGVFFSRLRPAPLSESNGRVEIRVQAQAGDEVDSVRAWVDGRPLRAHAVRRAPFVREIWGRLESPLPPGEHVLVAFARAGDTAGALAWPFEVQG